MQLWQLTAKSFATILKTCSMANWHCSVIVKCGNRIGPCNLSTDWSPACLSSVWGSWEVPEMRWDVQSPCLPTPCPPSSWPWGRAPPRETWRKSISYLNEVFSLVVSTSLQFITEIKSLLTWHIDHNNSSPSFFLKIHPWQTIDKNFLKQIQNNYQSLS